MSISIRAAVYSNHSKAATKVEILEKEVCNCVFFALFACAREADDAHCRKSVVEDDAAI